MSESVLAGLAAFIGLVLIIFALSIDRAEASTTTDESLRIATAFWGERPADCATLTIRAADLPPGVDGSITSPFMAASVRIYAGPLRCTILISRQLLSANTYSARIRACSTATHELGHLLGYGHSTDSDSVMFVSGSSTVRACFDRFIGRNARRDYRAFGDRGWSTR